jgi:hypothetical protein
MQSDIKDIYKITSTRTGKDEQIYKDIGDYVFKEVKSNLEKPNSLIIKLKGIGFWYIRRSKMKEALSHYPNHYEIDGYNDFPSEGALLRFLNKQEIYKIFKARMKDYERYLEKRAEVKILKNEFNKISEGKKEGESSSQD